MGAVILPSLQLRSPLNGGGRLRALLAPLSFPSRRSARSHPELQPPPVSPHSNSRPWVGLPTLLVPTSTHSPATGATSGHLAAKRVGDIPSEAPHFPHRSPIRAKEGASQVTASRWIPGKSVPALVPEPGEPRHLPPAVTHPRTWRSLSPQPCLLTCRVTARWRPRLGAVR